YVPCFFFFSSRRRHTRSKRDWSSDVCSSDLMLVWNGEHYNLGNVLGMKPNQATNYMQETYLGAGKIADGPIQTLHRNLTQYLNRSEERRVGKECRCRR